MYKDKLELKIAGVIGDPINHTRSPLIHQYWISKNQINCFYIPIRIKSFELEKIVLFKELNFSGLNVTIPHKENILNFVDEIRFCQSYWCSKYYIFQEWKNYCR